MSDDECLSCGDEDCPPNECPRSERPCGHHDNYSWTHDECIWCGATFGGGDSPHAFIGIKGGSCCVDHCCHNEEHPIHTKDAGSREG